MHRGSRFQPTSQIHKHLTFAQSPLEDWIEGAQNAAIWTRDVMREDLTCVCRAGLLCGCDSHLAAGEASIEGDRDWVIGWEKARPQACTRIPIFWT